MERLYHERYQGFKAEHFHAHPMSDYGSCWGYTWTKVFLRGQGLLAPAEQAVTASRQRINLLDEPGFLPFGEFPKPGDVLR